jgi:acetylglutamate kinase
MTSQPGGQAVGLCGTDGNMVKGHRVNAQLGFVGDIDSVDPILVQQVLDDGYLPIIAPMGVEKDGTCLNMNADLVASRIAGALQADMLTFLSNVDGIRNADGTVMVELDEAQAQQFIAEGVIRDGMLPKINACLEALEDVPCVQIANGGLSHVLLHTLEEDQPAGTKIVRENR